MTTSTPKNIVDPILRQNVADWMAQGLSQQEALARLQTGQRAGDISGLVCEEWVSSSSYRGRQCKNTPIVAAFKMWTVDETRIEGRCQKHVGVEKRRQYKQAKEVLDLTPEVVASIKERQQYQREREALELARKRVERQKLADAATLREQALSTVDFEIVRDDEKDLDWDASRESNEARYNMIPRWYVRRSDVETSPMSWDQIEIKITKEMGETRLEVRHASTLTPKQAAVLAQALAIATEEASK